MTLALLYIVFTMDGYVFYREFTRFNSFTAMGHVCYIFQDRCHLERCKIDE
nr:hypothetical protein [uncultured Sellimonas sp.]